MAFGNPVTDLTQVAIGTNGYILSVDLESQEIDDAIQVQAQKNGITLSAPITDKSSISDLFSLPENSAPPSLAFAQDGTIVYIFLKTSEYAYVSSNRIAVWYSRNPKNVVSTSDKLDIPQEAKELFKMLVLDTMYRTQGKQTPRYIVDEITNQKKILGLS